MQVTPTVGVSFRLDQDAAYALTRVGEREGGKTKYLRRLVRRDLERRGELPEAKKP